MHQEDTSSKPRKVEKVSGWKLLALLPLAIVTRIWAATLRLEPSPALRELLARDEPQVFLLWHNRLFVIAEIYRRYRLPHTSRHMHGLISASKDGAWLAAFFRLVGIRAIRGSSSWRAVEALREVVRTVERGDDIGITPDGPRGPCYHVHPGALLAARRAKIPTILLGMDFGAAKRLGSWDGFYLPKPFSRVQLDALEWQSLGGKEATIDLAQKLQAMNPDGLPHPREVKAGDKENA